MTISTPRLPEDHPDRAIECQFQIEPAYRDLVKQAVEAGWTDDDVATAMIDLARNHMKGIIADRRTSAEIADAGNAAIAKDNRADAQ